MGPGQVVAALLCAKVTYALKLDVRGLQSPFLSLSIRKGHFLPKFKHGSQQSPSLSGALLPLNPTHAPPPPLFSLMALLGVALSVLSTCCPLQAVQGKGHTLLADQGQGTGGKVH